MITLSSLVERERVSPVCCFVLKFFGSCSHLWWMLMVYTVLTLLVSRGEKDLFIPIPHSVFSCCVERIAYTPESNRWTRSSVFVGQSRDKVIPVQSVDTFHKIICK